MKLLDLVWTLFGSEIEVGGGTGGWGGGCPWSPSHSLYSKYVLVKIHRTKTQEYLELIYVISLSAL